MCKALTFSKAGQFSYPDYVMDDDPDMALHYIEQRIVSVLACQHSCQVLVVDYKLVPH